jgi:hypothetical protein
MSDTEILDLLMKICRTRPKRCEPIDELLTTGRTTMSIKNLTAITLTPEEKKAFLSFENGQAETPDIYRIRTHFYIQLADDDKWYFTNAGHILHGVLKELETALSAGRSQR